MCVSRSVDDSAPLPRPPPCPPPSGGVRQPTGNPRRTVPHRSAVERCHPRCRACRPARPQAAECANPSTDRAAPKRGRAVPSACRQCGVRQPCCRACRAKRPQAAECANPSTDRTAPKRDSTAPSTLPRPPPCPPSAVGCANPPVILDVPYCTEAW